MFNFNPRRHRRHHRRNPSLMSSAQISHWTQGVQMEDAAAAVGGLAAAYYLPGVVIKPDATGVLTSTQKWLRILVAAGAAVGVGYICKEFLKSSAAGKAAVIGGLAGTGVQVINLVKPGTVPMPSRTALPARRFGESTVISPSPNREGETVSLIQP